MSAGGKPTTVVADVIDGPPGAGGRAAAGRQDPRDRRRARHAVGDHRAHLRLGGRPAHRSSSCETASAWCSVRCAPRLDDGVYRLGVRARRGAIRVRRVVAGIGGAHGAADGRDREVAGEHHPQGGTRADREPDRHRRRVVVGGRPGLGVLPRGARVHQPVARPAEPPAVAAARRRPHRVRASRRRCAGSAIRREIYERVSAVGIAVVLLLFFHQASAMI